MAGRSFGKPYAIAIAKAPQFEKALIALPRQYLAVLNEYLYPYTTEDDFQQMVLLCCEVWRKKCKNKHETAHRFTQRDLAERKKETNRLYSRRNISFDQHIGDSKWPVSDWFNPCNQAENEESAVDFFF